MVAFEFISMVALLAFVAFVLLKLVCDKTSERIASSAVLALFGYIVWEFYFQNEQAQQQTSHPTVLAMVIVLYMCAAYFAKAAAADKAYRLEQERVAADH